MDDCYPEHKTGLLRTGRGSVAMTTIAGLNVHAAVTAAVQGVLPPMTLKQNGVDVPGEGVIEGNTVTFISRTITQPKTGDVIEYNGSLRTVVDIQGNEDGWELTVSDVAVPVLDPTNVFNFSTEGIGAGRVLLIRLDAGTAVVRGQWRNGSEPWRGFSMEGRSLVIETGVGEIEVNAYRVNADGTSTEPINRVVTAT